MNKQTIINRELSWLSFNDRVLQEAADESVPLLERIKFLGIFSNNLDEFFKVRVATIRRMIDLQMADRKLGMNPKKLHCLVQNKVLLLQHRQQEVYQQILRRLGEENIFIINENQLSVSQGLHVKKYFQEAVMPVFSPIMLKNVKTFPYLEDQAIYLATKMSRPNGEYEYALIALPTEDIPRFLELPSHENKHYVIFLDDIIRYCLKDAFSFLGFVSFEAYTIKFTRDAELDIDNDLTKSFLEKISKGIKGRRKGQPVRFVYDQDLPGDLLSYLKKQLNLDENDNLIAGSRYHNFKDFMNFPKIGPPHLEFSSTPPLRHPSLKPRRGMLKQIENKDYMLHVPYQDFNHFIGLLHEAAIDPEVKSIKMTIYRMARHSRVINALSNALKNGKQVTVVIELQARFDEQYNINWSRRLEEAGAKVLFGIPGLKVHCKLALITRKQKGKTTHCACVSTGNFHEGNARVYTDTILFTSDPRITREVDKVFDYFENTYKFPSYRHLLVSPHYMRRKFMNLIQKEIDFASKGRDAWIMIKVNSLVDTAMIKKLYQASAAGVKIRMVVRGICSLIPGLPGLSENIEVVSVVDKYLEHSRIFIFANGGEEKYYISSADWMTRNLDSRVEVACPVYDSELRKDLKMIIEEGLRDNVKARIINIAQDNPYRERKENEARRHSQQVLYEYYQGLSKQNVE